MRNCSATNESHHFVSFAHLGVGVITKASCMSHKYPKIALGSYSAKNLPSQFVVTNYECCASLLLCRENICQY